MFDSNNVKFLQIIVGQIKVSGPNKGGRPNKGVRSLIGKVGSVR